MKKYFQIMPLMSKLFLNSGYKSLKMNIAFFFTHYIDSKFLWYVHNVFTNNILFFKITFIIIFNNPKFKKIKQWLWLLMVHVSMMT